MIPNPKIATSPKTEDGSVTRSVTFEDAQTYILVNQGPLNGLVHDGGASTSWLLGESLKISGNCQVVSLC
jgi:hypothetical protein